MCECAVHTEVDVYVKAGNYDPTRTLTLRNAFVADMNRRFKDLMKLIKEAIVDQDVFALSSPDSNLITQQGFAPGRRAFDFPTTGQKMDAFMAWLKQQQNEGLLEITTIQQSGRALHSPWTDKYISDSYKRGVMRGRSELKNAGYKVPPISETGGIQASMSTPFHLDRVGMLYTRTFNELKGITDAMDQQISRVLAQGMIDGDGPALLARKINATISSGLGMTDTLGRYIPAQRRARMLARTEVIRAHHMGTIQEYRNWGAEGVNVQAEFRTAEDSRVCAQCESLHLQRFTLDQAEGIVPQHPSCRCICLPVRVGGKKSFDAKSFKSDEEAQAFAEANWAKSAKKLSTAEKDISYSYVSEGYDQNMNRMLRGLTQLDQPMVPIFEGKEAQEAIKLMDSAISKGANTFAQDRYAFRGLASHDDTDDFLKFLRSLKKGEGYTDKGYISTSLSQFQAESFAQMDQQLDVVLKIRLNKGKRYFTPHPDELVTEAEILLPRGTSFKVVGATQEEMYYVIELEIL